MKRLISMMLTLLLVLTAVLPTGMVFANEDVKYKDGEYDLPLTVLHSSKDDISSMGKYVKDPTVVIENGQATVTVTLTSSDLIAAFQVENNGEFIDSELISENVEENTRDVSFTVVKDLNEITAAKVSVDTGNPQFGVMHHDVRLQFDPSEIPFATDENPEQQVSYEDGEYDLPMTILHATEDKESSMGKYLQNPSVVIKDGKATVSLTLTSSDMIAAFQVELNGEFVDTEVVSKDEAENTRKVSFTVENLNAIMAAKVSVDTGNPRYGIMHHDVRLQFDPSEIPVAEEEPKKTQRNWLSMKMVNMIYR